MRVAAGLSSALYGRMPPLLLHIPDNVQTVGRDTGISDVLQQETECPESCCYYSHLSTDSRIRAYTTLHFH